MVELLRRNRMLALRLTAIVGSIAALAMVLLGWFARAQDSDLDGWNDPVDNVPTSRVVVAWGDPRFTVGDDYTDVGPAWWKERRAWKAGGQWATNPPASWHVSAADTGLAEVYIPLDRTLLTDDLVMKVSLFDHANASLHVDLLGSDLAVAVSNVAGNLMTGKRQPRTVKVNLPLAANPGASIVCLTRGQGEISLYTNVLFISRDGDELDTDQEAQLGTSDFSLDSDLDGMRDDDEVRWGLNPALPDGCNRIDAVSGFNSWNTGFEPGEESVCGELSGQNGWVASNGVCVVSSASHSGAQSVAVPGAGADASAREASAYFGAMDRKDVWVTLWWKGGQGRPSDVSGVKAAAVVYMENARVVACDGPSLTPVHSARQFPPDANGWWRLDVELDYLSKTYRVYANGILAVENIGFKDADLTCLSRVNVRGSSAAGGADVGLDDVTVSAGAPSSLDDDGDGLGNAQEAAMGTDPRNPDTDDDGLSDYDEVCMTLTDPRNPDTDGDDMPDGWELANGLNPFDPSDAARDPDGDGLTNLEEYQNGTRPDCSDTDIDDLSDFVEVRIHHTCPIDGDSDGDGMPDGWELARGLNPLLNDSYIDTDGDGLSNLSEWLAGTNPRARDSDGDGISDKDELYLVHSDPTVADFSGGVAARIELDGASASKLVGRWESRGRSLACLSVRGSVEYRFNVVSPGVYRLAVEGLQGNPVSVSTDFKLIAWCDDEYLGKDVLQATQVSAGRIAFMTPWLTAGAHSVRVEWDNVYPGTALELNPLVLESLGGPDSNSNGVPDWLDRRLAATCSVGPTNVESLVSPLCLQGSASYVSGLSVRSSAAPDPIVGRHLEGAKWYADAPLATNGPTDLAIFFERGAACVTQRVSWAPMNVLDGGAILLRCGDSLKLSASPAADVAGQARIAVPGTTPYEIPAGQSVIHTFGSEGSFMISGVFVSGSGVTTSNSVQVTALGGGFPASAPICWWGQTRGWNCPDLPNAAVVDSGSSVATATAYWLGARGRRLSLTALEGDGPHYAVARIAPGGPILDVRPLAVTWLRAAVGGGFMLLEYLSDGAYGAGTQVTEDRIYAGSLPAGARLRVNIWTSGAVFEDGSVIKWVEPWEVDATGIYRYRMLTAPGRTSVACHTITMYDGAETVGAR